MAKDERLASVVVRGEVPASVLFELQRMGRGWFAVERLTVLGSVPSSTLAVLHYSPDDAEPDGDEANSAVLILNVVCSRSSPLEVTRRRRVERFDVAEPIERLALLARLATQRTADSGQRTALVARAVRAIQLGFSLHLTVRDLAVRLDINPGTLRRWCQREGSGTLRSILIWGHVQAVCEHVARTGGSLAGAAAYLGFAAPSNLARKLRKATRLSFRDLVAKGEDSRTMDDMDDLNDAPH